MACDRAGGQQRRTTLLAFRKVSVTRVTMCTPSAPYNLDGKLLSVARMVADSNGQMNGSRSGTVHVGQPAYY